MKLKSGVNFLDLKKAHPVLLTIFADSYLYCYKKNLPFIVTSLFTDIVQGRISKTHEENRAFDLSVSGWTKEDIDDFIKYLERKYKKYAAIDSRGDYVLIPDINHGNGPHFHIQIRWIFPDDVCLE